MGKENNNWGWIIGLIIAAIASGIAIDQYNKKKIAESERDAIQDDYMTLLEQYMNKQGELPKGILDQLEHLKSVYKKLDPKIERELNKVISLIKTDLPETAIEKLTNIIENLVAEKLISDGEYSSKKKCPSLFKMLERAKEKAWIGKNEFHFTMFLKEERNEEAHEIAVEFGENWKIASFLGGIEIIYSLSK